MQFTTTYRRGGSVIAILAGLAMLVALMPSLAGRTADHLDAPGSMSPSGNTQADINDVYVFEGADSDSTVIAMTVHPVAAADDSFGADVLYEAKIDTDGDAVADLSYEFSFSEIGSDGSQFVVAQRGEGEAASDHAPNGELIGYGQVGKTLPLPDGGLLHTGLRSDPFFFDLAGFQGTVEGADNGRALNDGDENDFFAELDTLAIVIEVPDAAIGLPGGTFGEAIGLSDSIGVWASTSVDGDQIDRMGRPAINTVVNSSGPLVNAPAENKNVYNQAEPENDSVNFTGAAADALTAYSSLDTEGAYSQCQLETLASILLPDVLAFAKGDSNSLGLPPPLVGRALTDDVIDTSLRIVTGGDPLGLFGSGGLFCTDGPDRDADGAINTDGVGAHDDYLDVFPYLGEAHADMTVPVLDGTSFAARLSGDSEVPAVDTIATGLTAMSATNGALDHITLAYGVESAVAAHIHLGDPGENGPVVASLYGPSDGEDVDGMLSAGTVADADLVAGTMPDLLDVLNGGFGYVNVHTTEYPGGEIRGQINPLDMVSDRFTDDDDSVHATNIDLIAAAGITLGCNPPANTEYCPDRDISRGEMAAFLGRALNLNPGPDAFDDDEGSTFEADINAIAAVGITLGCNPPANTVFCPDESLTRGEMAAFVARAWALAGSDIDAFGDDNDSIFEADINALAAAGVTRGCNPPANTDFCPDRLMNRAEMASFIARAFGWGS